MKIVVLSVAAVLIAGAAHAQTQAPTSYLLSGEQESAATEEALFPQLFAVRQVDEQLARSGQATIRLSGQPQAARLASARWPVQRGQVLEVEVYAHIAKARAHRWVLPLAQALAGSLVAGSMPAPAAPAGEQPRAQGRRWAPYLGAGAALALPHRAPRPPQEAPLAYLEYTLFGQDGAYLGTQRQPVPAGAQAAWEPLRLTATVPADGFVQVALVNTTRTAVWFDDLAAHLS